MLDELIVANLGIIEHAHLEPGRGLVVITGETGAGKTMLLGALRLLMGATGRREWVGPFADEAVVDGRFLIDEDEVTLRRRVTAEGRSKAYVDGAMVPARALAERTADSVEVVGQHDHMLLTGSGGARRLVDGALDGAGEQLRVDYKQAWDGLVLIRQRLELLGGGRRELERELEMVRFQAEEIAAAGFEPDDEAELTIRAARLRNAEDLAGGLNIVIDALGDDGAMARLGSAISELARLGRLDASLGEPTEALRLLADELGELRVDLASRAADLDHEPGELDAIEERIRVLNQLRRKYGETLTEVLDFGDRAGRRMEELTQLLGTADELGARLEAAVEETVSAAAALTVARRAAADRLAEGAAGHLRELGMAAPLVRFDFSAVEPGPEGADKIGLVFASDDSLTPGAASRIASGGELSRLTLALRLAAGIGDAGLVAFDEVDAGIGGATALAMGEKLAALGAGRQLFCVTHLPQVAAHADAHYVVERSGSKATVRKGMVCDRWYHRSPADRWERCLDQVCVCHGRSDVEPREGHHRRFACPDSEIAWAFRRPAEARSLHQRRPGNDESVRAR
jgi:DNA repair protein RecN (Recombination protein N)